MEIPALTEQVLLLGAVAAVVVALVAIAVVATTRRRRERERLKDRFGPEYEHAVETAGSRKAVDDLHARIEQRDSFAATEPDERTRAALRGRLARLQYRFVDEPADVLLETQRVVLDTLRACGYPVAEDRERALKLLSVDHPQVTPSLRALLDGSYGYDVGRMQALFADAKRALRDVARLTYGPDDLVPAPPTTAARGPHAPAPGGAPTQPAPQAPRAVPTPPAAVGEDG